VEEESDSDLDYGRDSDDDSDDDYEETLKPWQVKAKDKKKTQLEAAESSDESMADAKKGDEEEPKKKMTEDVEAEHEDYAKVCIPRRRLIRWCHEPYFENAIKNCYVRIGIGRDNKTQKACYRLCKIDGIVTKDAYTFPADEGQNPVRSFCLSVNRRILPVFCFPQQ
jgi:RNA polymerase-associated protein RTF1